MNQLRLDPLSGRWVAVSTDRAHRQGGMFIPRQPTPDADDVLSCPFCPGNEGDSLPALEVYGPAGPSQTWLVRVVPNRYPAFQGDTPFVVEHQG
ncbi:MAG: galactose-1-phosphate uridylyltransferase, partial [Acidimicrobiales bacterium]